MNDSLTGATARLLILDDDVAIAEIVASIANGAAFQSRISSDARSFLQVLEAWQPTHIFLDLQMPDMDGLQVIGVLAERRCRAKLILSSGVGSRVLDAAARSARELGLDMAGILNKPFALKELRALLQAPDTVAREAHAPTVDDRLPPFAAADFRQAVALRQIEVEYQPKVSCHKGRIEGFEALARWQHPELGQIPPPQFIRLAEQEGLIDALTLQVLDKALAAMALWHSAGDSPLLARRPTMAINLSARSLSTPELINEVLQACHASKVAPEQLSFELTETAAMEDPLEALTLLTRLRVQGFALSLDDFGTGYSSMLQLVRLPFSELKIDRSFVKSATESQESRAVIRSIIELGHSLNMMVTAEGVETPESLDYLQAVGANLAQGFLIARPMGPEALARWLANYPRLHAELFPSSSTRNS